MGGGTFRAGRPRQEWRRPRVYYYHSDLLPVFLLTVFAKNEKANLTPAERNELKKLVEMLARTHGAKS